MLFCAIHLMIGTAINGKKEAGRYFFGSHAGFWEVRASVYYADYLYGFATISLFILCFLSVIWTIRSSAKAQNKRNA